MGTGTLRVARKGFTQIFNEGRESVTVYDVTRDTNDDDDEIITIANAYPTEAKMERGGGEHDIYSPIGTLGDADIGMYFPWTFTTGLEKNNYVVYAGNQYKIKQVIPYNLRGGKLVCTKVMCMESDDVLVTP